MCRILVGTCSWTDRTLVGSGWCAVGRRDAEGRLRHYAERFPVVEVDASYYALPGERNSRLWAERTPDGFVFDVKAFSLLTGHPTREAAMPGGLRADHRDPEVLDEVWARVRPPPRPLGALPEERLRPLPGPEPRRELEQHAPEPPGSWQRPDPGRHGRGRRRHDADAPLLGPARDGRDLAAAVRRTVPWPQRRLGDRQQGGPVPVPVRREGTRRLAARRRRTRRRVHDVAPRRRRRGGHRNGTGRGRGPGA
ncbi:DUF72 domain-containing protein [Streptomyces sp. CA-179760]|uniref:DUF72 domain-containing protein n=1 Tax=Streptomyces sp. CA-179760 TaxID=3240054 RepID=UPI003D9057C2